jgi:hypothetical protein
VDIALGGRRRVRHGFLLLTCAVMMPCIGGFALEAQVLQLRPIADVSLPTRVSIRDGSIHVRQKIGVTFGARMTATFNDRLDVVTTVTYSPASATLYGSGKQMELSAGSHSLGTSTGIRYWLVPPLGNFSWELHTGVGLVLGGRPIYEDLFESSTVSAVTGTSLRYQIGRIVSLKLRVQQRLFRLRFGMPDSGGKRPLQVTFGLGLPFLESLR